VILGKPEGISRPNSEKLISIATKRMQHHILDAVRLRRAPDHDVEPSARLRRKDICAKSGEIGAGHDAAGGRVLMVVVVAAIGLGDSRGAEEEAAVQVQHEELARWRGERLGGYGGEVEIGGRWGSCWCCWRLG